MSDMVLIDPPRGWTEGLAAGRLVPVADGPATINAEDGAKRENIATVNRVVNDEVIYQADEGDEWRIAALGGVGDCEDYAELKKQILSAEEGANIPLGALLLTITKPIGRREHCVLSVMTEDGDPLILDNFGNFVMRESAMREAGVWFIARQIAGETEHWQALDDYEAWKEWRYIRKPGPISLEDVVKPFISADEAEPETESAGPDDGTGPEAPLSETDPWRAWPNFSQAEMACPCGCGQCAMDPDFMDRLQALRDEFGQPMVVSSGYRCHDYNDKVGASSPEHPLGKAAVISISGEDARRLVSLAGDFPRLGIKQHGIDASRFIHLGTATSEEVPRSESPALWSYR